jgi:RecB family endonuclease NucS
MVLEYARPERIGLKGHAELHESWLQDRIAEDPSALGLGELMVLYRERRQERTGRLDLLLTDPDGDIRYEVELMLGATQALAIRPRVSPLNYRD